ncbi:hypothetical protein WHR41_07374 [Cladosporium halotolerans]|uniref:VOC domain-containing protein n=1 Tax=Cladosporium halotolerans TaxID=1052096 RepID=A0AB34KGR0_9PEZI
MSPNNTLYINLPVASLSTSLEFYKALGFEQNHEYSNDKAAMVTLSSSVTETPLTLMLATHGFFKFFLGDKRQLGDTKTHSEVILCVSMPTKYAVDKILEQAKTAGAETGVTTAMEMPGMYGGSFADLDGHIFEFLCALDNR